MHVLRHNWQIKLAALAAAIILNIYVNNQREMLRRTISLPVTVPPRVGQRVAEPSPGFQVFVELEGPAEQVRSLHNSDVTLLFDTALVTPGKLMQVPVTIELPEKYQRSVDVSWRPRSIPVRYVSDALRSVDVVPRVLSPPEGWRIKEVTAVPPRVNVSGPPAVVERVYRVVAPFSVEPVEVINAAGVGLRALDRDDNDLTSQVVLDPPQGLVTGMLERVALEKRVPVQPVFSLPAGRRVTVDVQPPRVNVLGPDRAVGSVYMVETEPVLLPAGQSQVAREVALKSPRNDVTLNPGSVRVTLKLVPAAPARPPR